MAEDSRTLWVGNLDEKVTEELLYELCLQTGPIDRLVLPTEGEGDNKKHKGHAYVVFRHPESVEYASQVLDGISLFSHNLSFKARSLPLTYKTGPSHPSNSSGHHNRFDRGNSRFDNSSLRGGFNNRHGRDDFSPRGRGNFRSGNRGSNYSQNSNYNTGYNNYNNQMGSNNWMSGQQQQQVGGTNQSSQSYQTDDGMQQKRQRLLQQQNVTLNTHRQVQQMANQMYGNLQQQQQQQQNWSGSNNYQTWNQNSAELYQSYNTPNTQYSGWYQTQQ